MPTKSKNSSQGDERKLVLLVRSQIEEGRTDDEIADRFELTLDDVQDLRKQVYVEDVNSIRHRPTEEIYVDYRLRQFKIARELGDLATEVRIDGDARGMSAAVSALKAQASIYDKVIDRGQEMGVIPRAAQTKVVVNGVMLGTQTDSELLEMMKQQASEAKRLAGIYGEASLTELPDEDIYIGEGIEEALPERVAEAKKQESQAKAPVRRKVV